MQATHQCQYSCANQLATAQNWSALARALVVPSLSRKRARFDQQRVVCRECARPTFSESCIGVDHETSGGGGALPERQRKSAPVCECESDCLVCTPNTCTGCTVCLGAA